MVVKNKLYKHHRSKIVLAMRNLSVSLLALGGVVAIVTIPTYIRFKNVESAEAQKVETVEEENTSETGEESETLTFEN